MDELKNERKDALPDRTESPGDEVQPDRVSVTGITVTAFALLILVSIISFSLWMAAGRWEKRGIPGAKAHLLPPAEDSLWLSVHGRQDPLSAPFPLLQTDPSAELKRFRAHEDSILNGYGWADRAAGKVRIPMEEAMRRLAAQGLVIRLKAPPTGD